MKRFGEIILGVVSLWPIAYMLIFMTFIISMFMSITGQNLGNGSNIFVLFGLHIFTIILTMVLITIYIINIFKNERVEKDKKVLWTIIILFGGIVAMPIYWYLYLWSKEKNEI